jgi:thymidylate kinase
VIIFDRYTYTHYAAGVGRYHHDPFAREMLSVFPADDRTYLLDVPTDEALRRIGTREEKTVDENPYMLARYRHALRDLAERNDFLVLDARAPFEENRKRIRDDVENLLEKLGRVPSRGPGSARDGEKK